MAQTIIKHRAVFFLPGFDPAAPRDHRERYRREGARQSEISGYRLAVSANPKADPMGWRAEFEEDGASITARIEVLAWSDLVVAAMRGGAWRSYVILARTAYTYARSGALWRLVRLRKGPMLAVLYPVLMLLAQLALAVAAGVALAALITRLPLAGAQWPLAGVAGGLFGLWLLERFKRQDGRFLAHYLMRDFAYAAGQNGAYTAPLEARLRDFAQNVERGAAGADEILIVGHSSGAYLAVSLLADLQRRGHLPDVPVALLTLGQVIPMVSFLPGATRLRADLQTLAQDDAITWLDVTAPGDGCAFALCDPVAVSGLAGARWPLVLSAAFSHTLSPAQHKALRWRFFRLHFQYLCAFDRPDWYDYFAITAGPMTLRDRIAARASSAGRITTPVSPHRGVAA